MEKTCIQCSAAFEITDQDLAFYEKISPIFTLQKFTIPPPTLCPDCRQQRRLAFRNERTLYHRKSDLSGKQMISVYSPDTPYKIYEQQEWWSDVWDPVSFGRDVDFSRPFFEQLAELMLEVPRRNLITYQNENSDYTNVCSSNKDCYLLFSSDYCEACLYVTNHQKSHHCVDCCLGSDSAYCYECFNFHNCYDCRFSIDVRNCNNCYFCSDCAGCTTCFMCQGLRNKNHCFNNEQLSKDDFEQRIKECRLGSAEQSLNLRKQFQGMRVTGIHRSMHGSNNEECSGDYLQNARHCTASFNLSDSQDCSNLYDGVSCKDSADCNEIGYSQLCFETVEAFPEAYNVCFSMLTATTSSMLYCDHCYNSKDLFGCVGMRKNQYCILNKQYSKEDFEELCSRLIAHMRSTGEWGQFFPITLSPFGYNETAAHQNFPLSREEVEKHGWNWHTDQMSQKNYLGPRISLDDDIRKIDDQIFQNILLCSVSGKPYKIIPQELRFYRERGLPVPRLCPDERHRQRMMLRNSRRLWDRSCAKCQEPILTTYAPDRPETVYCEKCYLESVY